MELELGKLTNDPIRRPPDWTDQRPIAALAWCGAILGGPVLPIILWRTSSGSPDSIVYWHSRLAAGIWIVLTGLWIPIAVFGIFLPAVSGGTPARYALVCAGIFTGVAFLSMFVGGAVALSGFPGNDRCEGEAEG